MTCATRAAATCPPGPAGSWSPCAAPGRARFRCWPATTRRLLAAARFAGTGLICGGTDPGRRNLTNPLIIALDGGGGLPRLDTSRLRATWLAEVAELLGLATFMRAAGISCSQRLGDLVAGLEPAGEAEAVQAARGGPPAMIPLAAFEEIIDASGVAARIEAMLPAGVRPRQLRVRTLLAGMCLAQADHRPAHLTRVHQALTALSEDDQRRLGVIADWKHGPHLLTYRQTERTFGLVADALARTSPAGCPPARCRQSATTCSRRRIPEQFKDGSRSLAVDWTDLESFSRPPPHGTSDCADPEASWGHRKNNLLRSQDELFYGYYLSAGFMMPEENGPGRPRARPPRHAVVAPARPGPRLRPRADRDARPADPARRHPRRLRLRPPRRQRLGHPAAGRRRPARPGPPPPRPRPQGHPRRRDHRQRQPVLPAHTPHR